MADANEPSYPAQASGLSFTQGFLLGQLSIVALIIFFIKFFIFGELPPADERALHLSSLRRARTLALQRSSSHSLRRKASSVLRSSPAPPTAQSILAKTYYNVLGHQPESLDWFNVLVAQTIAQLRSDARQDDAVLGSLMQVMNGPGKPDWVGDIRITEIALGDEFPIFSNCRVIPVEEGGLGSSLDNGGSSEGRLQARMDVDLGDVITLGVETTLQLNYPKPLVAVLPVALAVSVVRFSGTLSLSFIPSSAEDDSNASENTSSTAPTTSPNLSAHPNAPSSRAPTTLAFTFLDDYRLDLSVRSLVGSRSRLQDVPKIAQLIESRIHAWFDERVVEPRFQQIVLPSLWPRKKTTRGGGDEDLDGEEAIVDDDDDGMTPVKGTPGGRRNTRDRRRSSALRKSRTGASAGSPATKNGSLRLRPGVELDSFEARMEAEGERMRVAEERAGVRPRNTATNATPRAHSTHRSRGITTPSGDADVRWRPRHDRQDSDNWRIPGSMPEGL